MLKYPPQAILGFRKDGRPIRVIAGGDPSSSPSPVDPATLYENGGPLSSGSGPSLSDLIGLASQGSGAIATSGPDVWGTQNYADMPVLVDRPQSGGPLKPTPVRSHMRLAGQSDEFSPSGSLYQQLTFADDTKTVNEMLADGYKRSPDEIKQLQQQLWLAGMYDGTGVSTPSQIPYGTYDENTIQAYANLLKLNATHYARGLEETLPQTLAGLIQQRTQTGQANGTTRTSTSYDMSDPETAKAILSNVLQAYTGVGVPDSSTVAAFKAALNSYEQQHPSVTTSTYGANGGGTDTASSGGLTAAGRQQFAQDYLFQHQGNQVADYQAATTYYQAALQALRAPVQVG